MFHAKVTLPESHPDYPSITQSHCIVTGGLYVAQMTFSGSCSSIVHRSGGIRATTENGGALPIDTCLLANDVNRLKRGTF